MSGLLWGAVAAIGQHTMLFLIIIRRIHVRFENEAPVFSVDPSGPIRLSKDSALSLVWIMAAVYGLAVVLLIYYRPHFSKRACFGLGVITAVLALAAAMAEPLWGLVLLADFLVVWPVLRGRCSVRTA